MARSSFQRGSVQLRKRRDGWAWVLRYRARDLNTEDGWQEKTEFLALYRLSGIVHKAPSKKEKPPKEVLIAVNRRMGEINAENGQPVQRAITFKSFASRLWQSYVANRNYKPSTVYVYNSMLDNYVLPGLGSKRIDQISPEDITMFLRAGCKINFSESDVR